MKECWWEGKCWKASDPKLWKDRGVMVYLKWNGSCSQGSFENITVVISTMETEISTFTLGFNWTHSKVTFSQCDKVWYLWHLYVIGMVDGSSIDTGDTGDSVRQSYTGDLWILLAWHESECLKHLQKCYIQRILYDVWCCSHNVIVSFKKRIIHDSHSFYCLGQNIHVELTDGADLWLVFFLEWGPLKRLLV